jgi:hypothetical protein
MAEVEALAAEGELTEVHPELAFATVAGEPLPRKRSWPGLRLRREVLEGSGIDLPARFPGDTAPPDDVVDAAVCAWVADGLAIGADGAHGPGADRPDSRTAGRSSSPCASAESADSPDEQSHRDSAPTTPAACTGGGAPCRS